MNEFKPASTLHDDYGKKPKPVRHGKVTPSFRKSKTRKCEHHKNGVCDVSREALRLGLRKNMITCNGNIPPDCKVRQDLASGKTVMEIYQNGA